MGSFSCSQKLVIGSEGGVRFFEDDAPGSEPFDRVVLREDVLVVCIDIRLVESLRIDMIGIVRREVEGIGGGEPCGGVVCPLVGELWGRFRVGTIDVRGVFPVVGPESNSRRKVARSIVSWSCHVV